MNYDHKFTNEIETTSHRAIANNQSNQIKTQPQKKRDRQVSMQKLLDAGLEVFSQVGYDAATIKMVSQRAGINESLINRYFDSKAGLLLAIIVSFIESENQEKQSYPPGETLEEEIINFLKSRLDHNLEKRDFLRVLISRAIVDPKISHEISKLVCKGGIPLLLERLKLLQEKGEIRPDVDVEKVGFSITSQSFSAGFMAHVIFEMEKDELLKSLEEFAKNYARGLRNIL